MPSDACYDVGTGRISFVDLISWLGAWSDHSAGGLGKFLVNVGAK